ncbi:ankyrin repeat-containing protein At5g02620-like isoform X1 [Sesamum indicum]|uniref:Ankyrin repeat-containing protein At5g02620-like isoform X1 n=1 Tax=Sesamum indicum TaxID=4182 RepID=A0A8M8UZU5_SESIN|nr:ankyrin repeat-containing protein At5g02620-like isoform X1 [Sesamum indicum]
MEKRLSDAALQGNVTSLVQILEEDPLILDKLIVSCISETPLHTAATLGHLDFLKELLSRKPELAAELDSCGCSPLHLAAAKGHVDVVKELLSAGGEVGLERNTDGRTALHVAAIKGRAVILAELIRVNPELTRVLTDRGETGLHLCVKWNRLEALKLLVEENGKDGELVNWKDCEGNTALHIAVAKKHIEQIINCLLTLSGLEVNALNKSGLTALDILRQSPRDLRDMEIELALRKAGASSVKDLHLITDDWIPQKARQMTKRLSSQETRTKKPVVKHKSTDWLGRKRSALMVVASLIATVAFQAGLTPPGGVWQDNYTVDDKGNPVNDPHSVGQSIMAYQEPKSYGIFMILNTIAFLSSLSIILLLVSGLPMRRRRWMWVQMIIMWIAITAQVGTYFVTLRHMSPNDVEGVLREVTEISVLTWLTLMVVVFMGNAVRMNLWVLRKYGYIKEKEIQTEGIEDDEEDMLE